MALVIDNGVETGDMNYVMKMGLIMLVVAMLSLAAGTLSGVFAAKASMGFGRNLRRGMFDNIQDFAFRNIDHFSTAGLVTRMTTDVTNVQNAYQMLVRMFVRAPIMMISAHWNIGFFQLGHNSISTACIHQKILFAAFDGKTGIKASGNCRITGSKQD